jgi:cell division protein ZapB
MGQLQDLAERIDRLALRHEELRRTSALMAQQLAAVTADARSRIDALLDRLPAEPAAGTSTPDTEGRA